VLVPFFTVYVPAAHNEQLEDPSSEYEPGEHKRQLLLLEEPVRFKKVPGEHGRHDVEPQTDV